MYTRGDILIDKEQESDVVVVQLSSRRVDEVVVKPKNIAENRYEDHTVYDYNARYGYVQPDEPVVKAVYIESLPTDPTELTREGRAILARNADAKTYAFPISRLAPTDDSQNSS